VPSYWPRIFKAEPASVRPTISPPTTGPLPLSHPRATGVCLCACACACACACVPKTDRATSEMAMALHYESRGMYRDAFDAYRRAAEAVRRAVPPTLSLTHTQTHRETHRHAGTQAHIQTDTHTYTHMPRQAGKEAHTVSPLLCHRLTCTACLRTCACIYAPAFVHKCLSLSVSLSLFLSLSLCLWSGGCGGAAQAGGDLCCRPARQPVSCRNGRGRVFSVRHTHTHTHTCMHTHTYTNMHTHTRSHMHKRTHARTCTPYSYSHALPFSPSARSVSLALRIGGT
jgi:hypothetical protein